MFFKVKYILKLIFRLQNLTQKIESIVSKKPSVSLLQKHV